MQSVLDMVQHSGIAQGKKIVFPAYRRDGHPQENQQVILNVVVQRPGSMDEDGL